MNKNLLVSFFLTLFCVFKVSAQPASNKIDLEEVVRSCIEVVGQQGNILTLQSSNIAQCEDCYYWNILSGDATIIGTSTQRQINVRINSGTSVTMNVVYFKNGVCNSCDGTVGLGNNCNFELEPRAIFECARMGSYYGRLRVYLTDLDWSVIQSLTISSPNTFINAPAGYTNTNSITILPTDFTRVVDFSRFDSSLSNCYVDNYQGYHIRVEFNNGCPPMEQFFIETNEYNPLPKSELLTSVNLFGDILKIDSDVTNTNVDIYSTNGNIELSLKGNPKEVNVSKLKAGVYVYKIQNVNGKVTTGKFIKK